MRLIEVNYDLCGKHLTAYVNADHVIDIEPNICLVNGKSVRNGFYLNISYQRFSLTDEQAQEVLNQLKPRRSDERAV